MAPACLNVLANYDILNFVWSVRRRLLLRIKEFLGLKTELLGLKTELVTVAGNANSPKRAKTTAAADQAQASQAQATAAAHDAQANAQAATEKTTAEATAASTAASSNRVAELHSKSTQDLNFKEVLAMRLYFKALIYTTDTR